MNKIDEARKVYRDAFKQDDDFRFGYEANIAMLIHDSIHRERFQLPDGTHTEGPLDLSEVKNCNIVADRIINLLFEEVR